jgi:hypothetical protein
VLAHEVDDLLAVGFKGFEHRVDLCARAPSFSLPACATPEQQQGITIRP